MLKTKNAKSKSQVKGNVIIFLLIEFIMLKFILLILDGGFANDVTTTKVNNNL